MDAQPVKHLDGIMREVGDGVRAAVEGSCRPAGVAVVVAHHAMPRTERGDQLIGPSDTGGVGPHHQQQR